MASRAPKLIKVQLRNDGDDIETPWAQDLGPAKDAPKGSRRVRLVNVPFLHAKPTWGDVIVVVPFDTEPFLMWDGAGIAFSKIDTRIAEDGGRYAMIVDYTPTRGTDGAAAFRALDRACRGRVKDLAKADIVCEGMSGPRDGAPGHAYLAVKDELEPAEVMARLAAAKLPCTLVQIHPPLPRPRKPKAGKAKTGKAKAGKANAGKANAGKAKAPKPRAATSTKRASTAKPRKRAK